MNDEQLRQAWQQPGGAELDAAELEALLDGRLAPERRAALLARVASDADAALQLQLAMDLRAAAADAVAGARVHRFPLRPAPRRLPVWLQALAACLVITLGAAVWMRPPAPDVLRSDSPLAPLAPADGAVLEAPPAQLRWHAQPGVGRYRVRLYDAQASLLWESAELAQPELTLAPGQRETLGPGHYYWRVEWPEGAGLGPYHFEVRR
ncbi:MAG: hypothetical protein JNL89_20135 [Rhodanobacteraceae bacterium]|nr:hypothetical protein [Rhodanobacteraceae bacterium]